MYEIVRIYLRFLERHGAFMLVWSQATYGDDALAKTGMRTRLVNARRFGQLLQQLSGEDVDPDDDPGRFGLAILVMVDRYWSYWRVNDFPFSEEEVVQTLGDVLGAFITSRRPPRVRSKSTPGRASRDKRGAPRPSRGSG